MATEKDFELKITVVVSGFGKERHWDSLAKEVRKALATKLGDSGLAVRAEAVRVVLPDGGRGSWYPWQVVVEPFDYDSER